TCCDQSVSKNHVRGVAITQDQDAVSIQFFTVSVQEPPVGVRGGDTAGTQSLEKIPVRHRARIYAPHAVSPPSLPKQGAVIREADLGRSGITDTTRAQTPSSGRSSPCRSPKREDMKVRSHNSTTVSEANATTSRASPGPK